MQNTAAKTVAKYGFVTITGENTKYYRVVVDNKNYRIAKNKLRYFDPAGLFESHSFKSIAPYMHKNYSNYNEFLTVTYIKAWQSDRFVSTRN